MADKTEISWTDATWSPVVGCSRVSDGCTRCYAERLVATRLRHTDKYAGLAQMTQAGPRWTNVVRCVEDALLQPLGWRKPRRIFVNSMSDTFHKDVPDAFLDRMFAIMALCPQHTFQVLTKRPERAAEYFASPNLQDRIWKAYWYELCRAEGPGFTWPLPNVWVGTSVEDQAAADVRIPHLLRVPAAVRFLSCEPLLGPLDLTRWGNLRTQPAELPTTWAEFAWPDWVPEKVRASVEKFWSASDGHGPREWLQNRLNNGMPAFGARLGFGTGDFTWVTLPSDSRAVAAGRWVPCWNNIGRVVTDDGRIVPASAASGVHWLGRELGGDGRYHHKIHWVIGGGESGPNARPCHPDWARSLRDQCAAAGVAFHWKQWGEWQDGSSPEKPNHVVFDDGDHCLFDKETCDRKSAERNGRWSTNKPTAMSRVGVKRAGRLLDGVLHGAFPEVKRA